jgi:prepilin-type N-terminal cleavage/methylation domain-containing protein
MRRSHAFQFRSFRPQPGFTLLEMVLAIVLLGILAAATAPLFAGAYKAFSATRDNIDRVGEMRYAMERMARELRQVRYAAGAYVIAPVGSGQTSISFTRDDGTVVTFNANGANLEIGYSTVPGTFTLSTNLVSLSFDHYQVDGTAATDGANDAFVQITLTLSSPSGGPNLVERTRVGLRNRA